MSESKKDLWKSLVTNIGVLLVLVGATAVKGDYLPFFILGLVLLALGTFDFRSEPKRIVMAEVIISAALTVGGITQLVMAKNFGTPQVFLVILLLGAILIVVESLRKLTD